MKRYVLPVMLILAVLLGGILTGCGGSDDPEGVAEGFLSALADMDFKKASKFGTENTQASLKMLDSMMKIMPEDQKKEMKSGKPTITGSSVEGDKAYVEYEMDGQPDTLMLVKEGNSWKVDWEKEM